MSKYAIIKDGLVTNKIEWNGVDVYTLGDGESLVDLTGISPEPSTGDSYDGTTFTPQEELDQ